MRDTDGNPLRNFTPGVLDEAGFAERPYAAGNTQAFDLAECDLTALRNGVYGLRLIVRGDHHALVPVPMELRSKFIMDA